MPAIVVTTETFVGLGRIIADGMGAASLRFVEIPPPLGGIAPELAVARGRDLAVVVAALIWGPGSPS